MGGEMKPETPTKAELRDEVERLRGLLADAQADFAAASEELGTAGAENDRLRAENVRLRKELWAMVGEGELPCDAEPR
jgi:regulator of replication initiation timing